MNSIHHGISPRIPPRRKRPGCCTPAQAVNPLVPQTHVTDVSYAKLERKPFTTSKAMVTEFVRLSREPNIKMTDAIRAYRDRLVANDENPAKARFADPARKSWHVPIKIVYDFFNLNGFDPRLSYGPRFSPMPAEFLNEIDKAFRWLMAHQNNGYPLVTFSDLMAIVSYELGYGASAPFSAAVFLSIFKTMSLKDVRRLQNEYLRQDRLKAHLGHAPKNPPEVARFFKILKSANTEIQDEFPSSFPNVGALVGSLSEKFSWTRISCAFVMAIVKDMTPRELERFQNYLRIYPPLPRPYPAEGQ